MAGTSDAWAWAKEVVRLTDKPVSIDGPPEVLDLGDNVWRKMTISRRPGTIAAPKWGRLNLTAICTVEQVSGVQLEPDDIVSVFAGRIMDTGRDPQPVIDAAKETGAQVLWASVREPYNILQAEWSGCDIVTVPPLILRKWIAWQGKPLEVVAQETIAQFDRDREGLW
jgi:transaldolase